MERDINLGEYIQKYGALADQLKGIKKETDGYKELIKEYLVSQNLPSSTSGNYEVYIRKSESVDLNTDKLLKLVKEWWVFKHPNVVIEGGCPWIKTKEYLDLDAMEKALYNMETIPEDLIKIVESCKTTTVTTALCYKKAKEKEE